ncbi:MAG: transporter [Candidatus Magasanikbacteria bacterium CG10_big_fil_rev_8_21_14_0_10_47_10]|uniref:Probable queuosine precursor transporter n=1 Tax=Candidatus Magasanikbacteria bacterium CG10_big_fil_rev_8_21_14_0_10_47_10 TaxID=1974652 RepID=A0A2H0TRH6_9BACT|nr:MAG: transporter [Candidatus Magasanikbacteria bacterium CG10_big_fil_rev_8_21_14_0_10_47_10]
MSQHFKLTILSALFVAGLLAANMLGSKVTVLFGVSVSVGIFSYPITFMITDAIAEVYGAKKTRQLVWAALIAQIFILALTLISIGLPASPRYELNDEYGKVFSNGARIVFASLVAFVVSQTHDIWAFEFWKQKTKGKFLWLRNNASTIVSQGIDSLIFLFLAFYKISDKFTAGFIMHLFFSYWLFKIAFAVLDTPFVYGLVKWLKTPGKEDKMSDPVPLHG